MKNCAIGDASFSCIGQLTPILENEFPVLVAETADDALLEDTTLAFVDISCPVVVTVTLDTCVAKVATLADVAGNLDELLFSARCALVSACSVNVTRVGVAVLDTDPEPPE